MEESNIDSCVNPDTSEDQNKKFRWSTAIEFPLVLVMFGVMLSDAPITNIIMYRTCVHSLAYPVEECRPFLKPGRSNITKEIEEAVQKYATFIQTTKSVMEALLPAVLSLFMVVWSDKHGRKPLLVWPILGITMSSMMIVAYSTMEWLGPWWLVASSVPYSLTGGFSILATAAMCYATDVTDQRKRSFRIMLIQAMFGAGMAGGSLASPYVLRAVGTVYLLLIATAMLSLAYAFTAVWIEESIANTDPGSILSVLNFSLVKELYRECFKWRPNHLRAQILLVSTANSLDSFAMYGLSGLGYLYMREKLHWSLQDYTQYTSVSIAISFVGSFLGVGLMQRILPIGDLAFSIISFASVVANNYIVAFAVVGWQMYLGSSVGLFGSLSTSLTRSFISKILPSEDVAKVFALMCAIEGLCPLVAPVLYNVLYAETLATFPGAIMLVTGTLRVVCLLLLGIVAYLRWRALSDFTLLR